MSKKVHYALVEGFINGAFRKVGEPIGELTEKEAKYLVLHGHASTVRPLRELRSEPSPTVLDKKTR